MQCRGLLLARLLIVLSVAMMAQTGFAEEKPVDIAKLCDTTGLQKQLANPPPRDPKIEKADEPYKISLMLAKPNWVSRKYVATLRLEMPKPAEITTYSADARGIRAKENESSPGSRSRYLAENAFGTLLRIPEDLYVADPRKPGATEQQGGVLNRLAKQLPQDRRDQAEIDFWIESPAFLYKLAHDKRSVYREFNIFADTPEEAQRRALALLTLLDQGYSRPLQLGLLEQLTSRCKQLEDAQKVIDTRTAEEQRLAEENQKYGRVNSSMLDQLRLQEMQFEIEQAGLDARVASLKKLLQAESDEERKKSLSGLLTVAEVDQASITARREKTSELLKKIKDGLLSNVTYERARSAQNQAMRDYVNIANDISQIREEIRWFTPFSLVENTIVVQPLEWTP